MTRNPLDLVRQLAAAVRAAAGTEAPLPPHLAQLMSAREHFTVLANDQRVVESFVRERARAGR